MVWGHVQEGLMVALLFRLLPFSSLSLWQIHLGIFRIYFWISSSGTLSLCIIGNYEMSALTLWRCGKLYTQSDRDQNKEKQGRTDRR
jgi:hypothetical protein